MERADFCAFSHFMADAFTELGSLSSTLKANGLILPKASAKLQRTVSEQEMMKLRCKPKGMLEKFLSIQSEGERVIFQVWYPNQIKFFTDTYFNSKYLCFFCC